ncbi:MAG: Type 1 glutamine amidotransferase-like domain-containing protein [Planctomycetia bacterium]|nr:Type 1 glutamine amidotransferase-like domain-containing protein [Planctomycetia bacterium]
MHAIRGSFAAVVFVIGCATQVQAELRVESQAVAVPDRAVPKYPAGPIRGTLFLGRGCGDSKEIVEAFLALAGGEKANIVVPTFVDPAGAAAHPNAWWRKHDWAKVRILTARNRADAESADFLEKMRKATGVWFDDDSVRELIAIYGAPLFLQELKALLDRDGVVGGDLRGAQALSQIVGVRDAEKTSAEKTPAEKTKTGIDIVGGFGLLPNCIVGIGDDVSARKADLAEVMNRYPGRVGFDLDDDTALVVRGRMLGAVGTGSVNIVLAASTDRPVNTIRLRQHMRDDLTALTRAAIARTQPSFPLEKPAAPLVPKGSLLVVGGGGMSESLRKKFVELSGGADKAVIAVIPTASENPAADEGDIGWLMKAGAKKVVIVHARTRAEANSPELIAKLRECGGVWFGGGRQWRFVDAYEGTACYDEFHAVLARGGAIGGSSAGATIQGEYLVRGSPIVNTIMMAEGYERGFNFMPGTAIDQHFTQRNRKPDMEGVKRTFPQLLGLGIDEGTAIVVQGSQFEVVGQNEVSVFPPSAKLAADAEPPAPQVLKPGDIYDLKKFKRKD